MRPIDLNCDLGEGASFDDELMRLITSANIACGRHAGDPATMRRTVKLAVACGVAVGAHPGYDDRVNFGRVDVHLSPEAVAELVRDQVFDLMEICRSEGATLAHMKPHGALYNRSARHRPTADAIAAAVASIDRGLILVGLSGSESLHAARHIGLPAAAEVFADRTYQKDGRLTPRAQPGASITDVEIAVCQVIGIAKNGLVEAVDGTAVAISADTVCVHGDGPHAVAFASAVRHGLSAAGITIRAMLP